MCWINNWNLIVCQLVSFFSHNIFFLIKIRTMYFRIVVPFSVKFSYLMLHVSCLRRNKVFCSVLYFLWCKSIHYLPFAGLSHFTCTCSNLFDRRMLGVLKTVLHTALLLISYKFFKGCLAITFSYSLYLTRNKISVWSDKKWEISP